MKRFLPLIAIVFPLLIPSAGEPEQELQYHDQDYVLCCAVDFSGEGFCQSTTYYQCYSFRGRVVSDCSDCEYGQPGK